MSAQALETVALFALSFGVVLAAVLILKGPHVVARWRGVEDLEQFSGLTWIAILIGGGFGLFGAYYAAFTLPGRADRRRALAREAERCYLDAQRDDADRAELAGEWSSCRVCGRPVLVDCVCIGCAGVDPRTTHTQRGCGGSDDRFWESIDAELRPRRGVRRLPLR